MPLSDVELRVLGALLEKERTTPENYPLSTQALVTACNQRTSRDPVTDFHFQEVLAAVNRLRDRGLAETVQEVSDRVPKHRHRFASALGLDAEEVAVLAVLLLRGAQTPGELRSRTERYVGFPDVGAVERALQRLHERSTALVRNLGRGVGQSQDRWVHTLGADEEKMTPRVRQTRQDEGGAAGDGQAGRSDAGRYAGAAGSGTGPGGEVSKSELMRRLEALEARVAELETRARG